MYSSLLGFYLTSIVYWHIASQCYHKSSNNVLIHGKTAKITDFGTSEKILVRKTCSDHRGTYAYLDPKCFNDNDSKRDEKSDVFSFGIVLWEISSREYPCGEFKDIFDIRIYRLNGGRHDVVPDTPEEYRNLYTECWDLIQKTDHLANNAIIV